MSLGLSYKLGLGLLAVGFGLKAFKLGLIFQVLGFRAKGAG